MKQTFFINKKLSFPIILVGSSMGGWLSILLGKKLKSKIKGIIGIGTAPDFTRQIIKNLSNNKKKIYKNKGFIKIKTKYDSDDYIFTKNFINDSKKHFVLESPIKINSIIHLLYGSFDEAVNLDSQLKLLKTLNSKITKLTIIKNSDHRMSSPSDLETLRQTFYKSLKIFFKISKSIFVGGKNELIFKTIFHFFIANFFYYLTKTFYFYLV